MTSVSTEEKHGKQKAIPLKPGLVGGGWAGAMSLQGQGFKGVAVYNLTSTILLFLSLWLQCLAGCCIPWKVYLFFRFVSLIGGWAFTRAHYLDESITFDSKTFPLNRFKLHALLIFYPFVSPAAVATFTVSDTCSTGSLLYPRDLYNLIKKKKKQTNLSSL